MWSDALPCILYMLDKDRTNIPSQREARADVSKSAALTQFSPPRLQIVLLNWVRYPGRAVLTSLISSP